MHDASSAHSIPSVALLVVALAGALFVLNAYRPLARRGALSLSAFFAGWLISELPLFHVGWQLVVTVVMVRFGALGAWPGWAGLGIMLASWGALVHLALEARDAGGIVETGLAEGLGPGYPARVDPELSGRLTAHPPLWHLLVPLARRRDVEVTRDIPYGEHGRRNRLDIYRSRDGALPMAEHRPVIIQVHGGAWVIGRKDQQGQPLLYHLAAQGWVCVAINYRLSPRATFPDHLIDVKRAIAWVKEHIAEHGGDPDFVAITGGSAGGHLCSLAALTAGDRSLQPGFEDADTSVAACVPFYGVYDFTNRKGVGRADTVGLLERLVMKKTLARAREDFDRASPMSRITADAPPFLVIHGRNDTLVPVEEARLFVEMLRETSRAKVAYLELPRAQHAFEVFSSVRAGYVIRGVARFLAWAWGEHKLALLAAEKGAPAALAPPTSIPARERLESAHASADSGTLAG